MDIIVFSKSPLPETQENPFSTYEAIGNSFRYTVDASSAPSCVLDTVFHALTGGIVERRLRREGIEPVGNKNITVLFEEKLSAYLNVAGIRAEIEEIIQSLLDETGIIDIEGIITFRLKEFSDDISAFFDLLFYEYHIRRQYNGFICLMRDYIKLEQPREEAVHIVFSAGGVKLYNANKADVTCSALKHYNSDSSFQEGNLNDFLISSLMHYLPERIIIHAAHNYESPASRIIETISLVFGERAAHCCTPGCELCRFEHSLEALPDK